MIECLFVRALPSYSQLLLFCLDTKESNQRKNQGCIFSTTSLRVFRSQKNALRYAPFERFFAFFRKTLRYALRSKNEAIPPSFLSFHLFSESKRRFARF